MANEEHLAILRQGVEAWNAWRAEIRSRNRPLMTVAGTDYYSFEALHADLREADLRATPLCRADLEWVDLNRANLYRCELREARLAVADLCNADLRGADLRGADLRQSKLRGANLMGSDFGGADLQWASLGDANLRGAAFHGADLRGANLNGANLHWANLDEAKLQEADLRNAIMVGTSLVGANLTGCRIYGLSAWDLSLDGAIQKDLVITADDQPGITVDNLEVAQFIYLLLHNEKVRGIIDTITSKVVLILGRFTPERKAVLDALREELRSRDYLPVLFDFEKPAGQTVDETVSLLARMARFVVADITDAKSVLQELRGNVPQLPSVPVQPLILASQEEPGMFAFFRAYPWVLETYRYAAKEQLLANLSERVIAPAEAKAQELRAGLARG